MPSLAVGSLLLPPVTELMTCWTFSIIAVLECADFGFEKELLECDEEDDTAMERKRVVLILPSK